MRSLFYMKPGISIIISTKNEGSNIGRLIDSVVKSSSYDSNIDEIIVVDHPKTTDNTKKIASQKGAVVFTHGTERSTQRNFGVEAAKNQIVVILDADMEITYGSLIDEIRETSSSIDKYSFTIPEVSSYRTKWDEYKSYYREFIHNDESVTAPRVFSKANFLDVGGFDPELSACEDWDLRDRIKKHTSIKVFKNHITHHESIENILEHLKKKAYYGTFLDLYLKKNKSVIMSKSSAYFLRKSFWDMISTINIKPEKVLGATVLLTLETCAGCIGYTYGRITGQRNIT